MCRTLARLGVSIAALSVPALAATISFSFQTVIDPADVAFTQLLGINNASKIASFQSIDDPNGFDYRFATHPLGGASQIDVIRGGKPQKLSVALETAPDSDRNEITLAARSPFQGATVANISPAVADELHLDADTEGVVVTELSEDSTAATVGFQKGDIILAVNNKKISKTGDLDKVTREQARLWRITLLRGGQQINVTLGG